MEVYKVCFENYEISNLGNCRRKLTNGKYKEIKGSINNRGYKYFQVVRDGKRKNKLFHQMVMYSFVGERPIMNCKVDIDHIDRNKLNNRLDNLRYVSHKFNLINVDRYRDDIKETDTRLRTNILNREYTKKKRDSKNHHCSICDLSFNSNKRLERHLSGNRHKLKQLYKIEMDKNGIEWNKDNYKKCKSNVYDYNRGKIKSKPIVYP